MNTISFEEQLLKSLNKKAMLIIQVEEELKANQLQMDSNVLYDMETEELLELLEMMEPAKKI